MKKIFRILVLTILISTGIAKPDEAKSQTASVSFSVFYNSLKPYGRWVQNPAYGQVWISSTGGFVPYSTGGHWAYTNYGWTWVSDYDWGWAPFHYGRWAYDPAYGWFWVPGYDWAPAWVAWRGGGDYYGWAPLSPGLSIGVSYNSIPADRWVFAPHQYITSPYITRYYIPRTQNVTIIKNTTVVNNVTVKNNVHYVAGPRKEDVEKVNHTRVQTYTVANSSKPGKTVVNNNTINVYRPVVNNKTIVNNNSTTVNKNSNSTVNNNKSKPVIENKKPPVTNNKHNNPVIGNNNKPDNAVAHNNNLGNANKETVNKKPADNKQVNNKQQQQQIKPEQKLNVKVKPQQQKQENDVAHKKNQNDNNNKRRK